MLFVITTTETTEFCLYVFLVVTCSSAVFALDRLDVAVLIEVIAIPRGARLLASGCPFSENEKPKRRKGAEKKEPVKDQSKRQKGCQR